MDPVWLHLLVNHIPIIGTAFGLVAVLGGVLLRNVVVKRTGLVLYIVAGLSVFPANFTGKPAEEKVEKVAGISEKQIHEHEEAAETMMTLTSLALVLALVHLFGRPAQPGFQNTILVAFVAMAVWACVQGVITGHEGGLIRRPELGGASAKPPTQEQTAQPEQPNRNNNTDTDND
jgi:hypothetical protein